MPLDPQAQALLEMMAAAGRPALHEQTPEEARAGMDAMRELMGPGEDVANVEDRRIPGPNGEIPIRIYAPAGESPFPLLVYFHGGGWVVGSVETYDATCRALTNATGSVVVSVEYRLAPEHKYPAPVEDCYAATVWAAEHAAELGGDPDRLAVGGDSAGGNLAASVAILARDRGGPRLGYQALVYPVTACRYDTPSYTENAEGYLLTKDAMVWFWDHYLRDEADAIDPCASPLLAEDLRGLPPALVVTAEYDPLRDEGEAYAERLREAGVPTTQRRYDGQIHGFFGMPTFFNAAGQAMNEIAEGMRSAFAVRA